MSNRADYLYDEPPSPLDKPGLPKYDPIDTLMRQWWCSSCLERGPKYNAGDPAVIAGWAVHVGKHERESERP